MKASKKFLILAYAVIACAFLVLGSSIVLAHCDTMDGPVIIAAKKALETGDANLVLIWVQKDDEVKIRKAFERTLAVRKLDPAAQEMADMYFFETLVRIHRAGEGAPYTGLKPAGTDLGSAIPAADKAIETGSLESLMKLITATIHEGVHEHFRDVISRKNYSKDDVEAGREFVEKYVIFLHYIEKIYSSAKALTPHNAQKSGEAEEHAY